MSTSSRWLNWTPHGSQIIETSPGMEPSKPSKMNFEGFDGSGSRESPIIGHPETPPASVPSDTQIMAAYAGTAPTKPTKLSPCPYDLPAGIRLLGYTQKRPPVVVTVCSVVTDPDKFIRHALAELDARLHHPIQIKAGDSVFDLLSKLADCGLELAIQWPPETPGELKAATPPATLGVPNVHGVVITDEDIPF